MLHLSDTQIIILTCLGISFIALCTFLAYWFNFGYKPGHADMFAEMHERIPTILDDDETYPHNPLNYTCPGQGLKCLCWDIDQLEEGIGYEPPRLDQRLSFTLYAPYEIRKHAPYEIRKPIGSVYADTASYWREQWDLHDGWWRLQRFQREMFRREMGLERIAT